MSSNAINNYCSDDFFYTLGDCQRYQADWRGEIQLIGGPIHFVSDIVTVRTGISDPYADFDDIDTIYYLLPEQVVDVYYTHGWLKTPQDVQDVCADLCRTILEDNENQNVRSFTVGDVQEEYSPDVLTDFLNRGHKNILAKYGGGENWFTIDTSGSGRHPYYLAKAYQSDPIFLPS